MYMDYSKLWKLLLEKNIRKTDLLNLTGISSRVMAKLSKNETVTTETLGRICTALHCDVSDIVECASEEARSLYEAYRRQKSRISGRTLTQTVRFSFQGQNYAVCLLREPVNRRTEIRYDTSGTVHFRNFSKEGLLLKNAGFSFLPLPGEIGILLLKGNPGNLSTPEEKPFLVMTEAAFKVFAP